jgi:quaternary ammonium compound-resistance protein SugE
MAWIALLIAGLLEIVWALSIKQSDGFTRLLPSMVTIFALVGSLGLLAVAMRTLPLGTAYAVFVGIGAIGVFIVGVTMLGEQISAPRVGAVLLIVIGVMLLKLSPEA